MERQQMERRRFQDYNCDLVDLHKSIEIYFAGKGFRVTNFHINKIYLTQAHKNELGNKSLFIKIEGTPKNFEVSIGLGEKIKSIQKLPSFFEKIPFSNKLLLGELRLEKNFWNFFTTKADLRRNTFGLIKTTVSHSPQILREREILREVEIVYCKYCGTKNNANLTNCIHCGAPLH
jgi:hypothetical protein